MHELAKTAEKNNCNLTVLLEIATGQKRCGVDAESEDVVNIASAIQQAAYLSWGGLQCYHGAIQHERSKQSRRELVFQGPVASANRAAERLKSIGITCPIITGGGTGTFIYELEGGVHNEIQPGSFLFMDGDYNQNEDSEDYFEQSLFVLASVISSNTSDGRRVLDAGSKAIDLLSGPPTWIAAPHWRDSLMLQADAIPSTASFRNGGDEHGILDNVPTDALPVGSCVALVPSHCDPTVNQHTSFIGMRDGVCTEVFPIEARGW